MAGLLPKDPSQRRRRNATNGFERLPAEGRQGPTPRWPFKNPTAEQRAKWAELWKLPQAVKWEQMHAEDTVALYVIALLVYLDDPTETKLLGEVRQLDAKLGVSPKAMLNIRWTIEAKDDVTVVETNGGGSATSERVFIPDKKD